MSPFGTPAFEHEMTLALLGMLFFGSAIGMLGWLTWLGLDRDYQGRRCWWSIPIGVVIAAVFVLMGLQLMNRASMDYQKEVAAKAERE